MLTADILRAAHRYFWRLDVGQVVITNLQRIVSMVAFFWVEKPGAVLAESGGLVADVTTVALNGVSGGVSRRYFVLVDGLRRGVGVECKLVTLALHANGKVIRRAFRGPSQTKVVTVLNQRRTGFISRCSNASRILVKRLVGSFDGCDSQKADGGFVFAIVSRISVCANARFDGGSRGVAFVGASSRSAVQIAVAAWNIITIGLFVQLFALHAITIVRNVSAHVVTPNFSRLRSLRWEIAHAIVPFTSFGTAAFS
jgi:hypothetical protein